jgi:hypothetical protein
MTQQRAKAEKVQIIACGALAREIQAVCALNALDHMELTCLPAIWHNHPERIADGVRQAIAEARRKGFRQIFVAYADCGTAGALDRVCEAEGVARIAGPHCYSFFAGNDAFASRWDDDMAAFFLTDFLVRQFDAFVIRPLGLDRHPELRDAYFGNYEKLVYLAQTDDAPLLTAAKRAADRLGLAFEHRRTGYGDLPTSLLAAAGRGDSGP